MSTMTFLTLQQEVRSRVRLDLTDTNLATLIKRWINQSQQEIWSKYDWPWALEREIVQTVADKTAGTVSVSAGGTTVTGSSTAFASADVGKFIQFQGSNDWYKITAVASATSLTIEASYNATSALSAGTYTIRKFFYSVSSSVEKVLSVRQVQSPHKLTLVHFRDFDAKVPHVTSTGKATSLVMWGYDSSDNWQFSVYPSPDAAYNLEVRFKKKSTDMSADSDVSDIPEKWHSTVLLDGALYRALEYARSDMSDRRAETKYQQFRAGIDEMIADAEPGSSDHHPILQSQERTLGVTQILKLPAEYGE